MKALDDILKNLPEIELDSGKKKILLIYAAGLLLVFVVYIFVFLKPSLTKLFDIIPRTRALKADIKIVNDDSRFEDKLNEKLLMLRNKMSKHEKKLSRETELPKLLESLSNLARSSRVKIIAITPFDKGKMRQDETDKKTIYQEVPITIIAQSGYHDLGVFLNKLENDERHLKISNISIKTNDANPKRHDVEFVIYAYTFKAED